MIGKIQLFFSLYYQFIAKWLFLSTTLGSNKNLLFICTWRKEGWRERDMIWIWKGTWKCFWTFWTFFSRAVNFVSSLSRLLVIRNVVKLFPHNLIFLLNSLTSTSTHSLFNLTNPNWLLSVQFIYAFCLHKGKVFTSSCVCLAKNFLNFSFHLTFHCKA